MAYSHTSRLPSLLLKSRCVSFLSSLAYFVARHCSVAYDPHHPDIGPVSSPTPRLPSLATLPFVVQVPEYGMVQIPEHNCLDQRHGFAFHTLLSKREIIGCTLKVRTILCSLSSNAHSGGAFPNALPCKRQSDRSSCAAAQHLILIPRIMLCFSGAHRVQQGPLALPLQHSVHEVGCRRGVRTDAGAGARRDCFLSEGHMVLSAQICCKDFT